MLDDGDARVLDQLLKDLASIWVARWCLDPVMVVPGHCARCEQRLKGLPISGLELVLERTRNRGHIFHLNSLAQFPGATSDLRQRAGKILTATGTVHTWLEAVKKDAIALLNDQQLNQPSTLATFNDLANNAENAYSGQVDPLTGQLQHEGVQQLYTDMQHLAIFQLNKVG